MRRRRSSTSPASPPSSGLQLALQPSHILRYASPPGRPRPHVRRSRCTRALPTTAASACRHASRDVLRAARCRSRPPPAAPTAPAPAPAAARRPPASASRDAGDAEPRDHVEKPAPSSADRRIRSSVVVGLIRKIGSSPASHQRRPQRLRLLDRVVEDQHAVDAGVRRVAARTSPRPSAGPGSRR